MNSHCFIVPALSRADIRAIAQSIRDEIGWTEPYFPIVEFVELGLPKFFEEFILDIALKSELKEDHGQTFPDKSIIRLREDVYERALKGDGFYRFTVAHELGHLVLHRNLPMTRSVPATDVKPYRSSEWQADCFGGELLMCATHIGRCNCEGDAPQIFGVSEKAAQIQWKIFSEAGLIHTRKRRK